MNPHLILYLSTLCLGTILSMRLSSDSVLFLPLYVIAGYQLSRLNYNEGFFLIFKETTETEDNQKVRLGPAEIVMKGDWEKNEDRFIDLFDWRRVTARQFLSWAFFAASIYLLFFRMKIEINPVSVLSVLAAFLVTRAIAVGHLLFPMSLNLLAVMLAVDEFGMKENLILLLYGTLFIMNLALIYPSQERLSGKMRDWLKGHWWELAATMGIILCTFALGLYIFRDFSWKKELPVVKKEEIRRHQKEIQNARSSLRDMSGMGLMQPGTFQKQLDNVAKELTELERKNVTDPEKWEKALKRKESIMKRMQSQVSQGPLPPLTPDLLENMKSDLRSAGRTGIHPGTLQKMDDLLRDMENFEGSGGGDLVSRYRELKFGEGGYYREESEITSGNVTVDSRQKLEEIARAAESRKDVLEKLGKNIEELRETKDESLQSVNTALKNELQQLDEFSETERKTIREELERAIARQEDLLKKASDPALRDKIENHIRENQQALRNLTPHLRASEKSELARKVLEEQKNFETLKKEVREEIAGKAQEHAAPGKKEDPDTSYADLWKKVFRFVAIGAVSLLVFWFLNRLGKKGVVRAQGIPEELKLELEQELKNIRARKLSPREEVIETYNVLHQGLSTILFSRETPPSCIVYEGISGAEPELGKPTFVVTETFAKTFYGTSDVSKEDLRLFRKEIKRVFSFFEIRV